ncbi:hypothetical protein [Caballeronia sp. DA-9]|uniref:hypothetical protein n=1 Tax=Caballeronia sp. DA-9 TaxID=3436237 RepID=UPI003F6736E8
MDEENTVIVSVATEVSGSRVTLFEQEMSKVDVLRMFRVAHDDRRAIEEDLAALAASEVLGEYLYVSCFFGRYDYSGDEVSFPLVHALDAIEEIFGITAEKLRPTLRPENLAELVVESDRAFKAFMDANPDLLKDAELLKARHAALQDAIAAELMAEQLGRGKRTH